MPSTSLASVSFDLVIRDWPIRLVRTARFVWLWTTATPASTQHPGRPYLFGLVGDAVGEVVTAAAPPSPVLNDCLHLALLLRPGGSQAGATSQAVATLRARVDGDICPV